MKFYFWKFLVALLVLLGTLPLAAQDAPTDEVSPSALENLPSRLDADYLIDLPPEWVFINDRGFITFYENFELIEQLQAGEIVFASLLLFPPSSPLSFASTGSLEQVASEFARQIAEIAEIEYTGVESVTRGGHPAFEAVIEETDQTHYIGVFEVDGEAMSYWIPVPSGNPEQLATVDTLLASLRSYDLWLSSQDGDPARLAQWLYVRFFSADGTFTTRVPVPASWVVGRFGDDGRRAILSNNSLVGQLSNVLPEGEIALELGFANAYSLNGELIDPATMTLEEVVEHFSFNSDTLWPSNAAITPFDADIPALALTIDDQINAITWDIDGRAHTIRHFWSDNYYDIAALDQPTLDFLRQIIPYIEVAWNI